MTETEPQNRKATVGVLGPAILAACAAVAAALATVLPQDRTGGGPSAIPRQVLAIPETVDLTVALVPPGSAVAVERLALGPPRAVPEVDVVAIDPWQIPPQRFAPARWVRNELALNPGGLPVASARTTAPAAAVTASADIHAVPAWALTATPARPEIDEAVAPVRVVAIHRRAPGWSRHVLRDRPRGERYYVVIGSYVMPVYAWEQIRAFAARKPFIRKKMIRGRLHNRVVIGPVDRTRVEGMLREIADEGVSDVWLLTVRRPAAANLAELSLNRD